MRLKAESDEDVVASVLACLREMFPAPRPVWSFPSDESDIPEENTEPIWNHASLKDDGGAEKRGVGGSIKHCMSSAIELDRAKMPIFAAE